MNLINTVNSHETISISTKTTETKSIYTYVEGGCCGDREGEIRRGTVLE